MADITGGIKKLKEDLSRMTFKEKVDHLWTYYKSTLLIAIIAIVAVSVVVTSIINVNSDIIVSGAAVNVYLSEEGQQHLKDDYYDKVYDGSGLEKVDFAEMSLYDMTDYEHAQETEYTTLALAALISDGKLDYMIVDQVGLNNFIRQQDILQDLRVLFSQEELDANSQRLVVLAEEENKENGMPIALDITDTPFIQDNTNQSGKVYLIFCLNSPREDACRAIYQHILDWKK